MISQSNNQQRIHTSTNIKNLIILFSISIYEESEINNVIEQADLYTQILFAHKIYIDKQPK